MDDFILIQPPRFFTGKVMIWNLQVYWGEIGIGGEATFVEGYTALCLIEWDGTLKTKFTIIIRSI